MEVQIISDTIQKFNGVSYYKCGPYYQRKGHRLHREVWLYHNGNIEHGYHVHHIDGDTSNNQIDNLMCVFGKDHLKYHMSSEERKAQSKISIVKAMECAKVWHSSEEGKAFHSELAKNTWSTKTPQKRICAWCGMEYETRDLGHQNCDTYCCPKHKASALRWRRKHENQINYPGRKS